MAAATIATVRSQVAGFVHLNGGQAALEPFWNDIIPKQTGKAERWLRNALARFGREAVAEWPPFEDYHADLATFWSITGSAAALTDEQRILLQKFDCRAEIMALTTLNVSVQIAQGAVGSGRLSAGIFNRPFVGCGGLPAGPFAEE